jgi:endogenous inhibitor of DNA gyrase (YacG/DUF329 family)
MPQITCPTCKVAHQYDTTSACRPFCSERCRLIDLGAWSQERFKIPVAIGDDDVLAFDDGAMH